MFFSGKKIGYLSVYRNGEKTGSAGFVRISLEGDRVHTFVKVKLKERINGRYLLYVCANNESILLAEIELKNGMGMFENVTAGSRTEFIINERVVLFEELTGFKIQVGNDMTVEVSFGVSEKRQCTERKERKKEKSEEEQETETDAGMQIYAAENFSEDKWEQLQKQFRRIHPFGDERAYIVIELKDFVILREEYQKLVHNSFLLHGFYNYRHLIVGKDNKMGNPYETCFYLGVPGVFYEKEKMVAVMFGFEGFECEGAVDIGKSGYYLRQIQI